MMFNSARSECFSLKSVLSERITSHRLVLGCIGLLLILVVATQMNWSWLPRYGHSILVSLSQTLILLFSTMLVGFVFSIGLGLAQVSGSRPVAGLCHGFCTLIRGTPLLLQLWILYYGFGSVFLYVSGLRQSWLWPYLTAVWPYAFVTLTLSFAGYEGEVMRGALQGVPKGELEAAYAMGMSPWTVFHRIWLPRAIQRVLPTLNGEVILQLKATPLVATISFVDLYAVFARIRQETYIIYEPLIMLAAIYMIIAGIITLGFWYLERRIPTD